MVISELPHHCDSENIRAPLVHLFWLITIWKITQIMSKTMENRQEGVRACSARHCWLIHHKNRTVVFSNHGGLCKGLMDEHNSLVMRKNSILYQFVTSFSIPISLRTELYCPHFFSNAVLKGILTNAQKYAFEATNSDSFPQQQKQTYFNVVLTTNLTHFLITFLMCLFHFSTCLEQPSAHHQENQLYQYII